MRNLPSLFFSIPSIEASTLNKGNSASDLVVGAYADVGL